MYKKLKGSLKLCHEPKKKVVCAQISVQEAKRLNYICHIESHSFSIFAIWGGGGRNLKF